MMSSLIYKVMRMFVPEHACLRQIIFNNLSAEKDDGDFFARLDIRSFLNSWI